ncbi:uncharacterized protein [Asterias amurensis]|uniref:uncharacterized protein n=1 Tax=Asterias amurensis TaxID=7602 RepID=UPI003AB36049
MVGYQRAGQSCEACHFSTVPSDPYSYTFILEPQISPFKLSFSVEAYGSSAMVGLSEDGTDQLVIIEILFGYQSERKKIAVRACMPQHCGDSGREFAMYEDTSPVIIKGEYRPFWIHYAEGVVTAGKGDEQQSLVEWDAGDHHGRVPTQLHIGISTWETGYGEWDFCNSI